MVNETVNEMYDAALDVMGLHMLVTDGDRTAYLRNALQCLKPGAPMLFFRESYRQDMAAIEVQTYADWLAITGDDYNNPAASACTAKRRRHQSKHTSGARARKVKRRIHT